MLPVVNRAMYPADNEVVTVDPKLLEEPEEKFTIKYDSSEK